MMEHLHVVDWNRLEHAYGPAGSVPTAITNLLSTDQEVREGAIGGLHMSILHQGSIYSATAHAIPFLIELLNANGVAGKGPILGLLAGSNESAQNFVQHLPASHDHIVKDCLDYFHMTPDEAEQEFERERGWHEQTAAAIEAGMETYRSLEAADEAETRLGVAYLMKSLAAAGRFQDEATAYLLDCLDDADDQVRGMAIFSLGEVALPTPELIAQLEQQLGETTRPVLDPAERLIPG